MIKKITLFLLIGFYGFTQNLPLTENSKISILTCGLGPETYAMYGHTAIRIKDETINLDIVYNYGAFDFSTPNFALRFIKGDMQYFITQDVFAQFEFIYKQDNRSIYEQVLNLSLPEKQKLYQNLEKAINSDERFYTYKFIDRNCTTMVADKIKETLVLKTDIELVTKKQSYREILFPYMNNFWQKLGIQLIFGQKVDQKAQTAFLPLDFKNSLNTIKHNNKPLVIEEKSLNESNYKPHFDFLNSIYALLTIIVLLIISNKKGIQVIYFYVAGLFGVFFVWVGFYSLHEEVLNNYNILLFNPILLLFAYFFQKNKYQTVIRLGQLLILCLLIYLIIIANKIQLFTVLPLLILHFYWIYKIIISSKKLLPSKMNNGA